MNNSIKSFIKFTSLVVMLSSCELISPLNQEETPAGSEIEELPLKITSPVLPFVTINSTVTIEGKCDVDHIQMKVQVGITPPEALADSSCIRGQTPGFRIENLNIPMGETKIVISGVNKESPHLPPSQVEMTVNRLEKLEDVICDVEFDSNTSFGRFNKTIRQVGDKNSDGYTKVCIAGGIEIFNRAAGDNCPTEGDLLIPERPNAKCYESLELPTINNLSIYGEDPTNRPTIVSSTELPPSLTERYKAEKYHRLLNRPEKVIEENGTERLVNEYKPINGFRLENIILKRTDQSSIRLNRLVNISIDSIKNVKIDAGGVEDYALLLIRSPVKLIEDLEVSIASEEIGVGLESVPNGIVLSDSPVKLINGLKASVPGGNAISLFSDVANVDRITNSTINIYHSLNPNSYTYATVAIGGSGFGRFRLLDHSTFNVGMGPNPYRYGTQAVSYKVLKIQDSTISITATPKPLVKPNFAVLFYAYIKFKDDRGKALGKQELRNVKIKVTGDNAYGLLVEDMNYKKLLNIPENPQELEDFTKNGNSVEIIGNGYAIAQRCPLQDLNLTDDHFLAPYGTPGCF